MLGHVFDGQIVTAQCLDAEAEEIGTNTIG